MLLPPLAFEPSHLLPVEHGTYTMYEPNMSLPRPLIHMVPSVPPPTPVSSTVQPLKLAEHPARAQDSPVCSEPISMPLMGSLWPDCSAIPSGKLISFSLPGLRPRPLSLGSPDTNLSYRQGSPSQVL